MTVLLQPGQLGAQQPGWFSDKEYENVVVSFEYKLAQWTEAAFVLRTTASGRPLQQGVAVFLAHDFHNKMGRYITGAIAGLAEPKRHLPPSFDTWHKAQIRLEGQWIVVSIDGEELNRALLPIEKSGKGRLHFADLHHKYEVRQFHVQDLGERHRYVDSFSPFRLRGAGNWETGSNNARGFNGHGINYASPVLKDFLFSAEIKATNHANGGIFFRGSPDEKKPRGFEVQIYSPLDAVFPTGSIYNLVRSTIATDTENRWFLLQVLVRGRNCMVWVDGVLVASSDQLPEELQEGQIGLQIHQDEASVEWKNLRAILL